MFFMSIRKIYSAPVNLQITATAVSIGAESQIFYFWTSESLYFRNLKVFYFINEKNIFLEMANTFETGPQLKTVNCPTVENNFSIQNFAN